MEKNFSNNFLAKSIRDVSPKSSQDFKAVIFSIHSKPKTLTSIPASCFPQEASNLQLKQSYWCAWIAWRLKRRDIPSSGGNMPLAFPLNAWLCTCCHHTSVIDFCFPLFWRPAVFSQRIARIVEQTCRYTCKRCRFFDRKVERRHLYQLHMWRLLSHIPWREKVNPKCKLWFWRFETDGYRNLMLNLSNPNVLQNLKPLVV